MMNEWQVVKSEECHRRTNLYIYIKHIETDRYADRQRQIDIQKRHREKQSERKDSN